MKPDPNAPRDRSLPRLAAAMAPVLLLLILLPTFVETYQIQLVTYGLIAAIAALGFNLLLGYTGLLSFGHSAYFGLGAYTVAFVVQRLGPHSMEFYILIGIPVVAIASALFGYVCVRHTRIFFGILTLAISQVVYSLALKLYWVTGGSDGLRVPRPAWLAQFLGPPRLPAIHHVLLLLRTGHLRRMRRPDVGGRALAVRQSASGHTR
jgi:ABC-type branched-subunit amino acid transport system permease subunit